MSSTRLGSLRSLRRQQLLSEFTGLKQSCPEGIFVSLTPGDPALWSGVMFVRKGPYANAVLRFHISFPDEYPRHPPLVTFSTDIFHPLVSPLSNYTFAADAQDNGAISASTEPRLPPGGFSLRHGFPGWFPRRAPTAGNPPQTPPRTASSAASTPQSKPTPAGETPGYMRVEEGVSAYDLLEYIRSAFADEEVLDAVDVEASGDTGAWYAWRTYRRAAGKVFDDDGGDGKVEAAPVGHPSNWDWAGVWEDRVAKGIAASLSEAVLYGGAGSADDVIGFQAMEESDVDAIKGNLVRSLEAST